MRFFLHAKIHKARVTEANLHYVGSLTLDEALMERADIREFEKVLVVSNTTGVRLETYVIRGARDSGIVGINGAAAHLIHRGHEVILMTFHMADDPEPPRCVLVDEHNRFVRYLRESAQTESPC